MSTIVVSSKLTAERLLRSYACDSLFTPSRLKGDSALAPDWPNATFKPKPNSKHQPIPVNSSFSMAQFAFVWFRIAADEFDPRVPFAQKRIRAQHSMLRPGKHHVGHVTECYSGGQPMRLSRLSTRRVPCGPGRTGHVYSPPRCPQGWRPNRQ